MPWFHPDAEAYRRQRFTRPDAHRWLKPDPERWLSPEELRLEYPELYERKYGRPIRTQPPTVEDIRCHEALRLEVLSALWWAQLQVAMFPTSWRCGERPTIPASPVCRAEIPTVDNGRVTARSLAVSDLPSFGRTSPMPKAGHITGQAAIMRCRKPFTGSGIFGRKQEGYFCDRAPASWVQRFVLPPMACA